MNAITNRTKNSLKIYLLAVVCAFSSVVAFSSCSYAIASEDVSFVNSGKFNYYDTEFNGTMSCANGICQNNTANDIIGLNTLGFVPPNGTYYTDNIFRFDVYLWRTGANVSDHTVFNNLAVVNDTLYSLYDVEFEQLDANASVVHVYIKVKQQHTIYDGSRIAVWSGTNNVFIMAFHPTERMSAGSWSLWAIKNTSVDTQSIVNAINNQSNIDYSSQLNTINSGIGSVNNNIQNLQDSVDQSNQDANDRYEDEKDTINTNGENASDLWGETTFELQFTDPFTTLWNLFTDAQCVDITTLANLLNAPSHSTICSPWSSRLRQIFSPCFNLFAVFFAIGFFIRWLSDSAGFTIQTYETVYSPTSVKTRRKS